MCVNRWGKSRESMKFQELVRMRNKIMEMIIMDNISLITNIKMSLFEKFFVGSSSGGLRNGVASLRRL